MHELALAQAVLDVVAEHAGERPVERVEVRVGALRQVVPGSLAFCFEAVARGSVAEGGKSPNDSARMGGFDHVS